MLYATMLVLPARDGVSVTKRGARQGSQRRVGDRVIAKVQNVSCAGSSNRLAWRTREFEAGLVDDGQTHADYAVDFTMTERRFEAVAT
jgi:hypothetical protein